MNEIEIRYLRPEEWDDAMALAWKIFLRFEAGEYTEEGIRGFLDLISDERLKRLFEFGEYPVYAAFDGQKMIGMISLRNINHISLLFVSDDYHRRGIGKSLIEAMKKHVRRDGRKDTVTVNAAPFAVEFYHAVGFIDTGDETTQNGIIFTPMESGLI
ncbi:MAG: GNAT family N-acetyltransferase [Lachnospiraceae bacterium]|nr:GNAT family N-acetyltransferase [Lachnospiraceae bacterium]